MQNTSEAQYENNTLNPLKWYQRPLNKTLFFGLIWALLFAIFIPPSKLSFWQYGFFVGSVPSTLIWDWFNIQSQLSVILMALLNGLILLTPYWWYLKTQQQTWWLYATFSLYGFINAALGFTIIISLRNFAH